MITVEQIRQKIIDWQNDEITKEEIQEWAEEIRFEADLNEEEEFVGIEVISYLEFINIDKTTKEDIPYVLEYIDNAKRYEDEAYRKWYKYRESINYQKRAEELKNDPFYAPYCKF
jgi:hypothetical protein